MYKLYFYKTKPEDVIKIEDEIAAKIAVYLDKLGYASGLSNYWTPELQEALKKYYLIENFDERIAPDGYIDKEVLKFMEKQAK